MRFSGFLSLFAWIAAGAPRPFANLRTGPWVYPHLEG